MENLNGFGLALYYTSRVDNYKYINVLQRMLEAIQTGRVRYWIISNCQGIAGHPLARYGGRSRLPSS